MDGLLLVGHGSLRSDSAAGMGQVAARLARNQAIAALETCFLNYGAPDMATGAARLAARSATRIVVQPYFLTDGQFARVDIPRQVHRLQAAYPAVEFCVGAVLGAHARMARLVQARIPAASRWDAVVLVAHGSHYPQARAQIARLVRQLQAALGAIPVTDAFLDINQPDLGARCQALLQAGHRRLAVVPYFLHAGRHVKEDLPRILDATEAAWAGSSLQLLDYVHDPAGLAAIICDHYQTARQQADAGLGAASLGLSPTPALHVR